MLNKAEQQNLDQLLSSLNIANIELGLQIAQQHQILIDSNVIHNCFSLITQIDPSRFDQMNTIDKIHSLNKYTSLRRKISLINTHPLLFQHLRNLEKLKLTFNGNYLQYQRQLLQPLFHSRKIKHITFTNYPLSFMDEGIGNLQTLEELKITSAYLKELPKSIENLTNLKRLDIAQTQIKDLNFDLRKLSSLEELRVNKAT